MKVSNENIIKLFIRGYSIEEVTKKLDLSRRNKSRYVELVYLNELNKYFYKFDTYNKTIKEIKCIFCKKLYDDGYSKDDISFILNISLKSVTGYISLTKIDTNYHISRKKITLKKGTKEEIKKSIVRETLSGKIESRRLEGNKLSYYSISRERLSKLYSQGLNSKQICKRFMLDGFYFNLFKETIDKHESEIRGV